MICPNRIAPFASLLLISTVWAHANAQTAQHLTLTADIGKSVYFEDEPIFLLVRLKNVGSDTAWVLGFGAASHVVEMSVLRNGEEVPVGGVWVNYVCQRRDRCGEALAPGSSKLSAGIVQGRAGDERDLKRSLFPHHLGPGEYELRVSAFGLEAGPVTFRVRERSVTEANDVKELEAMQQMGWDTTRVAGHPRAAGYKAALIEWVEGRARAQPDDPFLPFLLSNGLYGTGQILWRHIQAGEVQRFDPDTSEVVSQLRLEVIEANKYSIAGAYLVEALTARHLDQLAVLAERLGATPAGDMARCAVQHARPR